MQCGVQWFFRCFFSSCCKSWVRLGNLNTGHEALPPPPPSRAAVTVPLPPPGFAGPARAHHQALKKGIAAGVHVPMASLKDTFLRPVLQHRLVIIDAATGSGKSTIVPLYLYEQALASGRDCRIVITQPRRLAAKGLAKRVSEQCQTPVGQVVGLPREWEPALRAVPLTSPSTGIGSAATRMTDRRPSCT